jgi:hypothetical protein
MLEYNHERAAHLHMYAAQAHAAAASAHRRCDHQKALELSVTAQAFSSNAAEKTEEIEKQTTELSSDGGSTSPNTTLELQKRESIRNVCDPLKNLSKAS